MLVLQRTTSAGGFRWFLAGFCFSAVNFRLCFSVRKREPITFAAAATTASTAAIAAYHPITPWSDDYIRGGWWWSRRWDARLKRPWISVTTAYTKQTFYGENVVVCRKGLLDRLSWFLCVSWIAVTGDCDVYSTVDYDIIGCRRLWYYSVYETMILQGVRAMEEERNDGPSIRLVPSRLPCSSIVVQWWCRREWGFHAWRYQQHYAGGSAPSISGGAANIGRGLFIFAAGVKRKRGIHISLSVLPPFFYLCD